MQNVQADPSNLRLIDTYLIYTEKHIWDPFWHNDLAPNKLDHI